MTSEEELTAALHSFRDTVEFPAGDPARLAKRGRRRQRAKSATITGGLAVGLVVVGIGVALNRTDGTTVIAAASSVPITTMAELDDRENPGLASTVVGERSAAPLSETTTLNALDMRQLVADQVVAGDLCNSGDGGDPSDVTIEQVQVLASPQGVTIANVTCAPGAYQPTSVALFVVDEESEGLLPVPVDWFDGEQISSETFLYGLVDLNEDADQLSLSVYVRYRGAGDCGMAMTHLWDPDENSGFVLETAHGVIECPDEISPTTATDWPQLYPPVVDPSNDAPTGADGWTNLAVSPACDAEGLARRADDVRSNPKVMACIESTLLANVDASQFWIEDVIDDGKTTLVVWRAAKFDGDFGLGTPWGHEEIHVTELTTWTDKLVRRLDWEDPVEADWMYAYRIEFVDSTTLQTMIGWHQGECYWVDRLDLDGNLVDDPGNPYPRPATLDELSADESLCVFGIDDEATILADRFRSPEALSSL